MSLLIPAFKKLGIILLSTVIPFFISLGVKVASLKLDDWINKLINKYPQHKEAIFILAELIKDHLKDMNKCNDFVSNTERQKSSKVLTVDDIKKEILPLISNDEDKKKIEDFLNLIESKDFKEEIDECVKINIKNMILEGLNININDIEDDDLRKEVIKYFKTFKKGKLDDENLDKLDNEEKKDDEKIEDNEEKKDDEKIEDNEELDVDDVDIDDDDLLDYLNDNPKDKEKMIKAIKNSDLDDDDKDKALKMLEESEISESLLFEGKGYGRAFLVGAFLTPVGGLAGMGGLAIIRSSIKTSVKKTEKRMKENIEKETDPEKKKKLEQDLKNYQLANRNSDGEILCSKSAKEKNIQKLRYSGKLPKDFSVEDLSFMKKDAKNTVRKTKKKMLKKMKMVIY